MIIQSCTKSKCVYKLFFYIWRSVAIDLDHDHTDQDSYIVHITNMITFNNKCYADLYEANM